MKILLQGWTFYNEIFTPCVNISKWNIHPYLNSDANHDAKKKYGFKQQWKLVAIQETPHYRNIIHKSSPLVYMSWYNIHHYHHYLTFYKKTLWWMELGLKNKMLEEVYWNK